MDQGENSDSTVRVDGSSGASTPNSSFERRRVGMSTGAPQRTSSMSSTSSMENLRAQGYRIYDLTKPSRSTNRLAAAASAATPARILRSATAGSRQQQRQQAAEEAHDKMRKRVGNRKYEGG